MTMKIDKKSAELRKKGITIVEDYLDEKTAERFHEQIKNGLENSMYTDAEEYSGGYGEWADADVPIANERTNTDEGMVDIFNPELEFEEMADFKNDSKINKIIDRASGQKYKPRNCNAYIRRSVLNPQRYHVDSYQKYKTFVYLTDVSNNSDGPFTYIEGSHNISFWEKFATVFLNKLKGRSAAPLGIVPNPEPLKVTASKGTLIIANQGGYHQGHPQSLGKERVLLTTSYNPENNNKDWTNSFAQKFAEFVQ